MSIKKLRPRFSLRVLFFLVTLLCVYLASWKATQKYGISPGTAQRSPMPFIIVEERGLRFKRGPSLILNQEQEYYVWFFAEPQELFVRTLRREWTGLSHREQVLLMKQIAQSRKELKAQSRVAR